MFFWILTTPLQETKVQSLSDLSKSESLSVKGAGLGVGRRIPELALSVTTVPGAGSVNGQPMLQK